MSSEHISGSCTSSLPGQPLSAVPNRPPDFHSPPLDAPGIWESMRAAKQKGQAVSYGGIWLPTETEPGYAYAREGEFGLGHLVSIIVGYARDIEAAKQCGLEDIVAITGLKASITKDPNDRVAKWYEMVFTTPEQFCDNVDTAADKGLVHLRVAVNTRPGTFTHSELVHSLGGDVPRLLITPTEAEPTLDSLEDQLHDPIFHTLGALGLDGTSTNTIVRTARFALAALLEGDARLAEDLVSNLELHVVTRDITACADDPNFAGLGFLDDPTAAEPRASKRIHDHLRQRRENAKSAAI